MFEFSTQFDADAFKTLSYLAKSNNGQFKSVKQAQFLTKMYRRERQHDTVDCVKANFGVDITEDQYIVFANAYIRWADYGRDSLRPVSWLFVMDAHGVVGQYKIKYVGTMRNGTSPDPSKTERQWQRTGEITPLVIPAAPEVDESNFVGSVGERTVITGVIKAVIEFNKTRRFSYYDSGIGYVTKLDVNGNDVVYFGDLGNKGDTITVKATIKDHTIRDGRKQTIISRPKAI